MLSLVSLVLILGASGCWADYSGEGRAAVALVYGPGSPGVASGPGLEATPAQTPKPTPTASPNDSDKDKTQADPSPVRVKASPRPFLPEVQAGTSKRHGSLRVLTYNLGLLRVSIPGLIDRDIVPLVSERQKILTEILPAKLVADSVDVAMLEEVWSDEHAAALLENAAKVGYTGYRPKVDPSDAKFQGKLMGSGLLLLVGPGLKLTSGSEGFTPFEKSDSIEAYAAKGILHARIEGEGRIPFLLLGTHLQALDTKKGGESSDSPVQREAHLAQENQIRDVLSKESEGGKVPSLIMGDLNVGPGYVESLFERFIAEFKLANLVEGTPLLTWDQENPLVKSGMNSEEHSSQIDHVLSQDGRAESGEVLRWSKKNAKLVFEETYPSLKIEGVPCPLSDHYGLEAEVQIKKE